MNYFDSSEFLKNYSFNSSKYWEEVKDELEIIHIPEYKHPERLRPKFRRFEIEHDDIGFVSGLHFAGKVMGLTATMSKDAIYIIVKNEKGEGRIPESILNKIAQGHVYIVGFSKYTFYRARRTKTEMWSVKRLLWECLKESQYVEFEEIKTESL